MIVRAINKILICCCITLFIGCEQESSDPTANTLSGRISIAHLKTLAKADSSAITDNITIEGYVVANDLYGEYYKSIVVCDSTAGIEIAIDLRSTAKRFPTAAKVTIHCNSLWLGNYGGRLILGAAPDDNYSVTRITESSLPRHFTIDKSSPKVIDPTLCEITEIGGQMIGNYVEIRDVEFTDATNQRWCDTDPETGKLKNSERTIINSKGHTLKIRTIAQCSYADEPLPSGRGRVRGIVEKFNSHYSLRIVNRQFEFDK